MAVYFVFAEHATGKLRVGPGGHRVKQPPYTSEMKIASFASKFQFVIKRIVTIMNF